MRKFLITFTAIFLLLTLVLPLLQVQAQSEDSLQLFLKRDFGYGGNGEIQGTFSMSAEGPETLDRVMFYIDEEAIGEVTEAPFKIRFVTDNYPLGERQLHATGYTTDGQELQSNVITIDFVTADAGWKSGLKIAVPILLLVFGVMTLSYILTSLATRKNRNSPPGTEHKFGFSGGSICPKCGRPTPLHLLGLNMGINKFDRCENCGKWSMMRPISLEKLRQAEADEAERSRQAEADLLDSQASEDEKLRKELDNSRFRDF